MASTSRTLPRAWATAGRCEDHPAGGRRISKLTGGMFGVGGGIQHVLSSTVALDGGLELGFGRFAHLYDDGDQGPINVNGSTTIRLRFGVMWRPSTRRSS